MDYELTLTVRNAPMLNAMRDCGMSKASELSVASGVNPVIVGQFLNLKASPLKRDGVTPKNTAIKISDVLGVPWDQLFPEKHIEKPLPVNKFVAQIEHEAMNSIAYKDPRELLEFMEEGDESIDKMIESGSLTGQEEKVLRLRFAEGKTLREAGKEIDRSVQRVRHIEINALRKLRHPSIRDGLIVASGIYGTGYE